MSLLKKWHFWAKMLDALNPKKYIGKYAPDEVGRFYDQHTDHFLQIYGEVIQAFRSTDVGQLLAYEADAMKLKPGMRVLDAGCGVCGPAIWFARHFGVCVEAITISNVQALKSRNNIDEKCLSHLVSVMQGDYHQLSSHYAPQSFDVVYFLESFGHAQNHAQVLNEVWKILKPGGLLYIKDLFEREALLPEQVPNIAREIKKINEGYRYHIADLYHIIRCIRQRGFVLSELKTIDLPLEEFENLAISNIFQEVFDIARIENWKEYIFPVDFFELKCLKPLNDIQFGNNKYFLQNHYYMQTQGRRQEDL